MQNATNNAQPAGATGAADRLVSGSRQKHQETPEDRKGLDLRAGCSTDSFFDGATDCGRSLILKARADIHEDDELLSIQSRALVYLNAGAPVHFRGPAGMGKTTLALHIAQKLGRPVALITGDSAMTSADLLGREIGVDTRNVTDRYIQSVRKTETRSRAAWADNALTQAVEQGHTLVYDEFTRAPAEANNALLSALEERILVIPNPARDRRYVQAHPDFRVILTSNPDEYVGVSAAPDALFDRMITFDLTWSAAETETGIVVRRTGIAHAAATQIVALVRALRARSDSDNPPSTRTAIMIARIVKTQGASVSALDEQFVQICLDVLETRAPRSSDPAHRTTYLMDLREQILRACAQQAASSICPPSSLQPNPPAPDTDGLAAPGTRDVA